MHYDYFFQILSDRHPHLEYFSLGWSGMTSKIAFGFLDRSICCIANFYDMQLNSCSSSSSSLLLGFLQKLLEQLGEDNDSLAKDGPSFTYSKIDSDCRGTVLHIYIDCLHLGFTFSRFQVFTFSCLIACILVNAAATLAHELCSTVCQRS